MVLVSFSPFKEPHKGIGTVLPGFKDNLLYLIRTTPYSFQYSSTSVICNDDPHRLLRMRFYPTVAVATLIIALSFSVWSATGTASTIPDFIPVNALDDEH